jgi:PPP family 3-phenylpropionic acid transporter
LLTPNHPAREEKPGAGFSSRLRRRLGSFQLLQAAFYPASGTYGPFCVVFLSARGIPNAQIGFILMVNSCLAILAQPLWGMLCDRIGSIRRVFVICLIPCMVLVPLLTLGQGFLYYLLMMALISVFNCPFISLADTWTIQGLKRMPENPSYGSVRICGSISFIPITLVLGQIANAVSVDAVFLLFTVLNVFTLLVVLCIPFAGVPPVPQKSRGNPAVLLRNYRFMAFMLCYFLLNIAVTALMSFMPQRITAAGGDTMTYSILNSIGALCEMPMFLLSPLLMRKMKSVHLIIGSMAFTALHLFLLSFNLPVWGILVIHVLRGFSYGLYLVGAVYYLDALAPDGLKTSAQSLFNTISGGLSGSLGAGIGGALISSVGLMSTNRMGAALAIFSLAVFLMSFRVHRFISQRENEKNNREAA